MTHLLQPRGRATRLLVAWYGLFQLGHFILNGAYLLNPGELPFHPPPEGWHPQTVSFLTGMAVADWCNTILTGVFVWGYFQARSWAGWLGTLTLTVSVYAEIVFAWGTVAIGADGLGRPYLWVNLPFLPVLVLFAIWCFWGATSRLRQVGAA